jgi:Skp family chaperone for outer membrane proteins
MTMKKLIAFMCLVALTSLGWAQGRHGERIKAFKTGYLTQELDLSPAEAEKFWPIYNDFEKRIFDLRVERRKEEREKIESMGGPEALSEKEAREFLADLLKNEEDVLKSKKELYRSLDKILPPAKLLQLYKAESDFNRRLLSEFRRKGSMNRNN